MTANGKITAAQADYALSRRDTVQVLLKVTERGLMPAMLKGDAIMGTLVAAEYHSGRYALTFEIGMHLFGVRGRTVTVGAAGHQTFWLFDQLTQGGRNRAVRATEAWLRLEEAEEHERTHPPLREKSTQDVERELVAERTKLALDSEDLGMCLWFAMCEKPATHKEPHPIFGEVPACDRCVKIGR